MPLTEDILSRLGTEVPLSKIDHALQEIWASDEAKTRSSLINFAIYSEDPEMLVRNNDRLARITADHSCRALLITCLPEVKPQRARAWINALCRPYQGKQVVCSEQISFVLEGGDAAQVQNVVFGHLDSDLPLFIWWQGSLTQHFEERLYSRLHTLIVDSSAWADPKAELDYLLAARDAASFDVRDLSWTRSHFLRTALASSFQDAKARERLPEIERVEISHAPKQRCAALLLAGWISQRLVTELDASHPGSDLVFKKADGSQLKIELKEADSACALSSLKVVAPCLELSITRDATSTFVHTSTSCDGHSHEEILPADVVSDSELIGEQLSRAGGNTHFRAALPLLAHML
ncbi:MAG: glucose-6-phosphate dehydrogenase assembly protein OpcA [Verrucomicrobiota bacterium]